MMERPGLLQMLKHKLPANILPQSWLSRLEKWQRGAARSWARFQPAAAETRIAGFYRNEWLLGAVLGGVVGFIALILLFTVMQPRLDGIQLGNNPAPLPTIIFSGGQTSRIGFGLARAQTSSWQPDASLLSASATWSNVSSLDEIRAGRTDWTYTFYSPAAQTVGVVTVVDGQAALGATNALARTVQPIVLDNWQLDSAEVVELLLAAGAERFFQQLNNLTLTMSLTNNPNGQPEWFISLVTNDGQRSLTLLVDAGSGAVLDRFETP